MYIYIKDGKIMAMSETEKDYSDIGWDCEETDEEIIQINGQLYKQSEIPEPTTEEKQAQVRSVREQYFADYVDWYQSKPLLWEEMTEEEKQEIADYREYLMDYTKEENWWEKNPMTLEEWKNGE